MILYSCQLSALSSSVGYAAVGCCHTAKKHRICEEMHAAVRRVLRSRRVFAIPTVHNAVVVTAGKTIQD